MSLTLKVTSLLVRTLAKPMANTIKRNAHEHERFRKVCVSFAQSLHRIDMRMRLGLLQDPAVIDRQIKKEVAAAEAARKKAAAPTVLTEAETKAEDARTKEEKELIRKKAEKAAIPRVRPLSEQKAIEMGANFASETFIFAVGIAVIIFEQWRQRRKARNARDDIREDLDKIQTELKAVKKELTEWKARQSEPVGLLGFLKDSRISGAERKDDEVKKFGKHEVVEPSLGVTSQPQPQSSLKVPKPTDATESQKSSQAESANR